MRYLLVAALLSGLGGCAWHSEIPDSPAERLTSATVTFIELAASGDRFEIESGRLALERSQVPEVRALAADLVADHTRSSQDMRGAARSARPGDPVFSLVSHHYEMLDRLRQAGPEFDALYRDYQIAAHQEALGLHRAYAANGNVVELQAFARATAPMIEGHLRRAQALPVAATRLSMASLPGR